MTEAKKARELKLKPRFNGDDFDGYNVVSGSITMDEPDEVYHLIEYSALQALIDENEKLSNDYKSLMKTWKQVAEENAKLVERLKKAEDVIRFYGEQDNWAKSFMGIPSCITNQEDHEEIKFEGEKIHCGGKRARAYLKKQGE